MEPTFALDRQGIIIAWNIAAKRLLGLEDSQAAGNRCWDLFPARDIFGNRYCCQSCPILEMARRGDPVNRCQLITPSASGEWLRVGLSTLVLVDEDRSEMAVVHNVHKVETSDRADGHLGYPRGEETPGRVQLTSRETEVLGLLAEGMGTPEIAKLLGISAATSRNHIRRLLKKLGVHSRLEAVVLAQRLGIV